jgi:hypothetical protein
MKDRRIEQVFSGTEYQWVEVGKRKGWSMYFVFIYEDRRMEPVKIILRRGEGGGRTMEEVNLTKI